MEEEHDLGELVPCGGGDPIPLLKPQLLVGRRTSCDISLRFPNVSSHHCALELINGYWHVRDLGSRNGIKVNGDRCDSKWLMPGDVLSIAKHRYELSYSPDGESPPPEDENPFALSLMEKAGLVRPERGAPRTKLPPAADGPPAERKGHARDEDSDDIEDDIARWLGSDD